MPKKYSEAQKQDILIRGVGLHLVEYMILGLFLLLLGVPFTAVFLFVTVLIWGLVVIGYAFYYEK